MQVGVWGGQIPRRRPTQAIALTPRLPAVSLEAGEQGTGEGTAAHFGGTGDHRRRAPADSR